MFESYLPKVFKYLFLIVFKYTHKEEFETKRLRLIPNGSANN